VCRRLVSWAPRPAGSTSRSRYRFDRSSPPFGADSPPVIASSRHGFTGPMAGWASSRGPARAIGATAGATGPAHDSPWSTDRGNISAVPVEPARNSPLASPEPTIQTVSVVSIDRRRLVSGKPVPAPVGDVPVGVGAVVRPRSSHGRPTARPRPRPGTVSIRALVRSQAGRSGLRTSRRGYRRSAKPVKPSSGTVIRGFKTVSRGNVRPGIWSRRR